MRESRRLLLAHRREPVKKLLAAQKQVVEIDSARELERSLIATICDRRQVLLVAASRRRGSLRAQTLGLPGADHVDQIAGPKRSFRRMDFAQGRAGRALLVTSIVDGELLGVAETCRVPPEDAHAKRVKGRDFWPQFVGSP